MTITTGSHKVSHYRPNNRLGGPGKDGPEVWVYLNEKTFDFHLDVYDKDGAYLGHVSFTVEKKDLKRV